MIKRSCEDPNTYYLCLFGYRLIFRMNLKHPYVGYYKPGAVSILQEYDI